MTFIISESEPHALLHDALESIPINPERTDLGGSKEEILGGKDLVGPMYEVERAVEYCYSLLKGHLSADSTYLSQVRGTLTPYHLFAIRTGIQNHMRWKVISLIRLIGERKKPTPEHAERVDEKYLKHLTEDVTKHVLSNQKLKESAAAQNQ